MVVGRLEVKTVEGYSIVVVVNWKLDSGDWVAKSWDDDEGSSCHEAKFTTDDSTTTTVGHTDGGFVEGTWVEVITVEIEEVVGSHVGFKDILVSKTSSPTEDKWFFFETRHPERRNKDITAGSTSK